MYIKTFTRKIVKFFFEKCELAKIRLDSPMILDVQMAHSGLKSEKLRNFGKPQSLPQRLISKFFLNLFITQARLLHVHKIKKNVDFRY